MINSKNNMFFKIIFKKKHVGNLRLNFKKKYVDFGIMIGDEKYLGKGIGAQSFFLSMKIVFVNKKKPELNFKCIEKNIPAVKLYKKFNLNEKINIKKGVITYSLNRNMFFKNQKKYKSLI